MKAFAKVMLVVSMLVCSGLVFAESAAEYVVQSVTGKVEQEVAAGKWEAIVEGAKLAPSVVVNTGLNSTLVVKIGDKVVTIKAMQKGAIDKLVAGTASAKSSVKIGAKAKDTSANADDVQGRTNVSTASTRASDATKDIEWDEK